MTKIELDSLATFDMEYIFLNLRAKSVGEVAKVTVVCPDDGETEVPVEIPLDDIKNNKSLKLQGFEITQTDNGEQYFFCDSYLHFELDKDNNVIDLFRYNTNNADDVLEPLSEEFGVNFISEYEDEYKNLASSETSVISFNISDLIRDSK